MTLGETNVSNLSHTDVNGEKNTKTMKQNSNSTHRGSDIENKWKVLSTSNQIDAKQNNKCRKSAECSEEDSGTDEANQSDFNIIFIHDIALQSKSYSLHTTPKKSHSRKKIKRSNSLPSSNSFNKLMQKSMNAINQHRRRSFTGLNRRRHSILGTMSSSISRSPLKPINNSITASPSKSGINTQSQSQIQSQRRSYSYSLSPKKPLSALKKRHRNNSSDDLHHNNSKHPRFRRSVSFADSHGSPLSELHRMQTWYHHKSIPSKGKYKRIRRRSHTVANSQFSTSSLRGKHHRSNSITSLNTPVRQKMRQHLSRQLTISTEGIKKKSKNKNNHRSKKKGQKRNKNKQRQNKVINASSNCSCIVL